LIAAGASRKVDANRFTMPLNRLFDSGIPITKPDSQEPDFQDTTFSKDIARSICNTLGEALSNPDFDAIVIGSGMYGAYCAAKILRLGQQLASRPLRVLVLEAGPLISLEHFENQPGLSQFAPAPIDTREGANRTRNLTWGMGWASNIPFVGQAYCVGGKGLYWGGWCPRMTAEDLQNWPGEVRDYLTQPPAFAPSFEQTLLKSGKFESVYELVEYEIGVKPGDDFVFDPVAGPNAPVQTVGINEALNGLIDDAIAAIGRTPAERLERQPPPIAVQTQSFISGVFTLDKYSSLPGLISAVREDRPAGRSDAENHIFVVPRTHALRLVTSQVQKDGVRIDNYRVDAIEVLSNGQRERIPVNPNCAVVLSLSTIESTRLALLSFPTAGRREGNEIMGRNLMAHLRSDFTVSLDRAALSARVQQKFGRPLSDRPQTGALHIQGHSPEGRYHLQLFTANTGGGTQDFIYKMIPDRDAADRLIEAQANVAKDKINIALLAVGEMIGDRNEPVRTAFIDIASEADRDRLLDKPRAWVQFRNEDNNPIWDRMYDAMADVARELGPVNIPPRQSVNRQGLGTTFHESGTLYMGDNPDKSVTDVNGRFHHVANAYGCDQALFPSSGSANPVLTGLCLARKVAESIVLRHVSVPDLAGASSQQERADGFEYLLEGANLAKWKPNDPARFSSRFLFTEFTPVILEALGDRGLGVIFFDDSTLFTDFTLRLQWKSLVSALNREHTANSGVFLRAPQPPADISSGNEPFYKEAVEVQIDDTGYNSKARRFGDARFRTGAIYDIAPARQAASKIPSEDGMPGFWNDFEISVQGAAITVQLNGKLVSETAALPQGKRGSGVVGLQLHTGRVHFRNIRIKRR
jgi:choline dehydrogenase-like flavoprotein